MKRTEVLGVISKLKKEWKKHPRFWDDSEFFAEELLTEIEKYMEPKEAGKHQSSYDIAMGNRCEWDKE